MDIESLKVPPEKVTGYCDPDSLGFETTEEVQPLEKTVGQDRAVSALDFGLSIDAPGYNIYVAGFPGTGRTTTLGNFLKQAAAQRPAPDDWCYVHNFYNPLQPVAMRMPAGTGRQLVQDLDELIRDCRRNLPQAFDSEEYRRRVEDAMQGIQRQREAITQEIDQVARQRGFMVQPSPMGVVTTPLKDGQPLTREQYSQLPAEERDTLRQKSEGLQGFIDQRLSDLRGVEREAVRLRAQIDRDSVLAIIAPVINELRERYSGIPALLLYLEDLRTDIAEHLDDFRIQDEQQPQQSREAAKAREMAEEERLLRYKANVLVDNANTQGAPVVFEYSPTYYNLFGRVEYRTSFGTAATDLTMIRPGAIHRANGGYLALQVKDVLSSPLVWETLKRVLRSREIRIENIAEQYSPIPTSTLRPEPIPINTKIILMGTPMLFHLLQRGDEDFRKFFKVKADFDLSMERTPENMRFYASFVCDQCRDMGLMPFHKTGVAKVLEYASRLVEHQGRLTTRFIDIVDVITEATYWAKRDGTGRLVMGHHVAKAVQERTYRSNLPEERLQQFTNEGTIMIDTDGAVVGQVNGMSVLDMGDYAFGRPVRITARTALGRGQLANVDREAQMTGRTHNKGFLIITGYIMGKYGQDKPLSFRSSIGFEQTYDEVEGDSASSAELYALLSGLANVPIQQGIAVTGSVNQRGEIQAIGGATYKIEGFFDTCKAKGLTGRQGVIIPRANIKNLVLREDVIQAIRDGLFTVYAVESVDQAVEVLTGVPAGQPDASGAYPEDSLNAMIAKNLERLASRAREFGSRDGAGSDQEETSDSGAPPRGS